MGLTLRAYLIIPCQEVARQLEGFFVLEATQPVRLKTLARSATSARIVVQRVD